MNAEEKGRGGWIGGERWRRIPARAEVGSGMESSDGFFLGVG